MKYADSGVDVGAGQELVRRIREKVCSTHTPFVLGRYGGFAGLLKLETSRWQNPVLVSSVDGVGTKLKLAFMTGHHRRMGEDLVSHCINDIMVCGAVPLLFADYLAVARLDAGVAVEVIEGMASVCCEHEVAMVGGETAEMPGFYQTGEYDVAGFILGVVEESQILTGESVVPGDKLIGLPSSGLHTNGYSLARAIVFDKLGMSPDEEVEGLEGSIAEALLAPHLCYYKAVKPLVDEGLVKSIAHITGGGLLENLPRALPEACSARLNQDSWVVPIIFGRLQEWGEVEEAEMFRTFNLGLGMILVVESQEAERVVEKMQNGHPGSGVVGEVAQGAGEVLLDRD